MKDVLALEKSRMNVTQDHVLAGQTGSHGDLVRSLVELVEDVSDGDSAVHLTEILPRVLDQRKRMKSVTLSRVVRGVRGHLGVNAVHPVDQVGLNGYYKLLL